MLNLIIQIIFLLFSWTNVTLPNTLAMDKEGILWDYCQAETFSPRCENNNVIVMKSARYGHIQLGRCIDADFGHLGCELDQLSWLDRQCSGKEACDISVADQNLEGQLPCSVALVRYLEAKYTCLKVFQISTDKCKSGYSVPVTSVVQYLSSETSKHSDCGQERKPWILNAKPGQQINISLTDFNWKKSQDSSLRHPCPVRYGYIIDNDLNEAVDICGGKEEKFASLHSSKGHSVQIIIDPSALKRNTFLVSFQAIGCPTYINSDDTWMKYENSVLTVGCKINSNTWKMRCIGNHWIGIAGNCKEAVESNVALVKHQPNEIFGMPKVITYTIIGGIFMVVICVVLTIMIGVFCIKSKPSKENQYVYMAAEPQVMQMNTLNRVENSTLISRSTLLHNSGDASQNQRNTDTGTTLPPHYFVLEKENDSPVYDVVYQNT